jgi:hypothetical protein
LSRFSTLALLEQERVFITHPFKERKIRELFVPNSSTPFTDIKIEEELLNLPCLSVERNNLDYLTPYLQEVREKHPFLTFSEKKTNFFSNEENLDFTAWKSISQVYRPEFYTAFSKLYKSLRMVITPNQEKLPNVDLKDLATMRNHFFAFLLYHFSEIPIPTVLERQNGARFSDEEKSAKKPPTHYWHLMSEISDEKILGYHEGICFLKRAIYYGENYAFCFRCNEYFTERCGFGNVTFWYEPKQKDKKQTANYYFKQFKGNDLDKKNPLDEYLIEAEEKLADNPLRLLTNYFLGNDYQYRMQQLLDCIYKSSLEKEKFLRRERLTAYLSKPYNQEIHNVNQRIHHLEKALIVLLLKSSSWKRIVKKHWLLVNAKLVLNQLKQKRDKLQRDFPDFWDWLAPWENNEYQPFILELKYSLSSDLLINQYFPILDQYGLLRKRNLDLTD